MIIHLSPITIYDKSVSFSFSSTAKNEKLPLYTARGYLYGGMIYYGLLEWIKKLPKSTSQFLVYRLHRFTERVFPHVSYYGHGAFETQAKEYGLQPSKLNAATERMKLIIQPILETIDVQLLTEILPHSNPTKRLQSFGWKDKWYGIPPALERKTKDTSVPPISTKGLLNEIALKIVQDLPPAHNVFEAVVQLKAADELVSDLAIERAWDYLSKSASVDIQPVGMIAAMAIPAKSFMGTKYSSIHPKHLMVIDQNGTMNIYLIPSAEVILQMLQEDKTALAFINQEQPLPHNPKTFYKRAPRAQRLNASGVMDIYTKASQGQNTLDLQNYGWSHTHSLLALVPFDMEKYIKQGRLQCVFHKKGA